jgi:hypothetical protein
VTYRARALPGANSCHVLSSGRGLVGCGVPAHISLVGSPTHASRLALSLRCTSALPPSLISNFASTTGDLTHPRLLSQDTKRPTHNRNPIFTDSPTRDIFANYCLTDTTSILDCTRGESRLLSVNSLHHQPQCIWPAGVMVDATEPDFTHGNRCRRTLRRPGFEAQFLLSLRWHSWISCKTAS